MPFIPTGTYSGESFVSSKMTFPLDLNKKLISHPEATFYMRVGTDNLRHIGVYKNDILLIDRSKKITPHSLVVFFSDGEYGLNTFAELSKKHFDIEAWGVVTYVIHKT